MKVLVCGLGSIGNRHLENIFEVVENEYVCGVEPDAQKAKQAKDRYSINVFHDLDSGLAWKPEMVWICTPNHLHISMALKVFKKSEAHLFIEKPVSDSLSSTYDLISAFKKSPRLIWVARNMRFHPGVTALKKALDDGSIGKPVVMRIHFSHFLPNWRPGQDYRLTYSSRKNQGGGIILDDIHDLDLANWFGGPTETLSAITARSGILDTDVEEVASINLIHGNGSFTNIYMDYLRRDKSRGIEVIGENGTLTWTSKGKKPETIRVELYDATTNRTKEILSNELNDSNVDFRLQRDAIMAAVEKPETWKKHLKSGLIALGLAEAAKLSAEKGVWIREPLRDIDKAFL